MNIRTKLWLCLAFCMFSCDDGKSQSNKITNNTNNTNNLNNINNTNNANNLNNINNTNVCDPACEEWETCAAGACELKPGRCRTISDCTGAAVCDEAHVCTVECPTPCRVWQVCEDVGGTPQCRTGNHVAWVHEAITIVDPVVNGTSLNMPVDGMAWTWAPSMSGIITSYGRDINDPSIAYVWHVDLQTHEHTKKTLSGNLPPADENFCNGEDWCQFIGFDPERNAVLITGPRAGSLMRIAPDYSVSLVSTSGARPGNSLISYTHVFDFASRRLYVLGALGPSGFSNTLYQLDLDTGVWSSRTLSMPQVYDNCLVVEPSTGLLYSFGGLTTTDGGNTSAPSSEFFVVDPATGQVTVGSLPPEMGARHALSCTFSPIGPGIFLHGGAVVNDDYNEIRNSYYNDLWFYEPASGAWERVLEATVPGTFDPPDSYGDQRFVADPALPNFGKNRGLMKVNDSACGLAVIGEVPVFTHAQLYTLILDPLCGGK